MGTVQPPNPQLTGLSTRPLIKRPQNTKFRTLLSIDGGGIKGIIPVIVLQQLETCIKDHIFKNKDTLVPEAEREFVRSVEDFDVDLTDYFDLVAGTSAGSWIACYIAGRGRGSDGIVKNAEIVAKHGNLRPGSMEVPLVACRQFSATIFPRRNVFSKVARVFRPTYPPDGLEQILRDYFGETTMKDLETGCLITSYDMNREAACSFLHGTGPDARNYTVRAAVREAPRTSASVGAFEQSDPDHSVEPAGYEQWDPDLDVIEGTNFRLRDIALASSSAPTYFRPAHITPVEARNPEELFLVDGGVVANNPTLQALTYAPNAFSLGNIREVAVFSLGCGVSDPSGEKNSNPGVAWWLTSGYLLDAFSNGTGEYIQAIVDFWIYRNLGLPFGQYIRIQRSEKSDTGVGKILSNIDNPDNIPALEDIGREIAEKNEGHIKKFVRDYIFAT